MDNQAVSSTVNTVAYELVNPIIELLFAAAIVYFIYGVVVYIANADNDEARTNGKKHILYSIIGLAIMAGVWGIIDIIANTIGADLPDVYEN